jgi:hypothetical protein
VTEEKAVNMHFRHVLRSITLALLACGFASPVMAQGLSRVELSGGWQLLYGEGNTESLNGWYGDVGLNLNRVVALVAGTDRFYETLDVSEPLGNYILNLRAETRMQAFLGGARFNLRTLPRIVPFFEVLGGVTHVSNMATTSITGVTPETAEFSETHNVLQIAGGVTVRFREALGVRVAVGQRRFFVDGETGSATRYAAGLTLGF